MRERPEHRADPAIAAIGVAPPALRTASVVPARQRGLRRHRRTEDVWIGSLPSFNTAGILRPQRCGAVSAAPHGHAGVAQARHADHVADGKARDTERAAAEAELRFGATWQERCQNHEVAPVSASPSLGRKRDLDMTTDLSTLALLRRQARIASHHTDARGNQMFRKRTGQSVAECGSANRVRLRGESPSPRPLPVRTGRGRRTAVLAARMQAPRRSAVLTPPSAAARRFGRDRSDWDCGSWRGWRCRSRQSGRRCRKRAG